MTESAPNKPSIGLHRRLRTAVLVYVGLLVGMLLAVRAGWLRLPATVIFPTLLSLIACPTVFWWAWMDEWIGSLRHDTSNGAGRRRCVPWIRGALGTYTVAMLAPVLMMLVGRRAYDALPVPVLMWVMTWHLAVVIAGLVGLAIWLPWQAARRLRALPLMLTTADQPELAEEGKVQSADIGRAMSRRAFLAGAVTCAPIMVSGSTVGAGLRQQGRFLVRRIEMHLPHLPVRLRGLTITHLSDFHVGRLFRPEYLDRVVEVTHQLNSDLIAITGDTVDHSADFLPIACDAFEQLQSRYGRFVIIGNHDLIDSPRQAVDYLARRERNFLVDRCETLDIGGERLRIAGLFWSRYDRARFGMPGHYERVAKTLSQATGVNTPVAGGSPPGGVARINAPFVDPWSSANVSASPDHATVQSAIDTARPRPSARTGPVPPDAHVFTLALAHHPHAFDALADAGADLTLAGHTHGGQLMVTPPGSAYPIGGGNLLFRYIYGEYRRGDSAMYVNSGVGNWFPIRINAPAEIVQIRLV